MIEKRPPAATSERENDCLISGSAMPRVATIIDGMKFEQGIRQTATPSRCGDASDVVSLIAVPI
jgi:hypothetical protein